MHSWQLQEAKARLSELVKHTERGPQQITVHGRPVAVVLSRAEYDLLSGSNESLVDFIRRSPLAGADDLDFPRDTDLGRDVCL